MLRPSTSWGPATSSSVPTGAAVFGSSPSRGGWTARPVSATGAHASSSPGKATTRAIPPAAVAGRRWTRTDRCEDTSTSTLATIRVSGRCAPRMRRRLRRRTAGELAVPALDRVDLDEDESLAFAHRSWTPTVPSAARPSGVPRVVVDPGVRLSPANAAQSSVRPRWCLIRAALMPLPVVSDCHWMSSSRACISARALPPSAAAWRGVRPSRAGSLWSATAARIR